MSGFPLFAGLALVAAAIVGLHLLRPRPRRSVVSSSVVWDALLRRRAVRPARWRWWLALALALGIGLLLAAALGGSSGRGFGAEAARTLILVDNGGSMAAKTRDGRTRWAHAIEQARGLARAAPGPVMVADTMGRAPPSGFVSREEALRALDRFAVIAGGAPAVPPLPPVSGLAIHLISDGIAAFEVPRSAVVHSVFEPADNVAVIRLAVRTLPADPLRVDALVQVFNASAVEKSVQLVLRSESGFSISQPLRMAPGELVDATFDVSGFETGVLAAAALAAGDALPDDDIAYTVVPAHRMVRVLLVARGDSALGDSLAALPGVRVESIDPARYRPDLRADAFVFEDFTPSEPPMAGALLFRPGPATWLPDTDRVVRGVTVDDWARDSAVAAAVPWSALSIRRAALWTRLPEGVQAAVRAGEDALVVHGRSGAPWTAVGFLPRDSDFPLQPSFPLFLADVLARLTEQERVQLEAVGPVRVPFADAQVHDGRGNAVRSWAVPGATLFDAARPDIFTVQAAGGRFRVAAALLDPKLADINRSRFADTRPASRTAAARPLEAWSLLVLAGLVLMLVDWAALTRRIAG
jgi:hypothetical protein